MDEFGKNLKTNAPALEVVSGSFACQRCDLECYEALFNPRTKELVWTCQAGHESYIEECRFL